MEANSFDFKSVKKVIELSDIIDVTKKLAIGDWILLAVASGKDISGSHTQIGLGAFRTLTLF